MNESFNPFLKVLFKIIVKDVNSQVMFLICHRISSLFFIVKVPHRSTFTLSLAHLITVGCWSSFHSNMGAFYIDVGIFPLMVFILIQNGSGEECTKVCYKIMKEFDHLYKV